MLVFDASRLSQKHLVLIFGVGLIGKTLVRFLQQGSANHPVYFDFSWKDIKARKMQSRAIQDYVKKFCTNFGESCKVSIFWSAGSGGFNNSAESLAPEFAAYEDVLTLTNRLREAFHDAQMGFHLTSSAGGLFEGQRFVGPNHLPDPIRPYSDNKLRQEQALVGLDDNISKSVYRLSTVYGYEPAARVGLVTALINNALHDRVTTIFGSMHTLRDFVFVDDIARFAAADLSATFTGVRSHFMVSSKPTSINEIVGLVRKLTRRPLYLRFETAHANALDNSYLSSCRPDGMITTSLQVGITKTMLRMNQSRNLGGS